MSLFRRERRPGRGRVRISVEDLAHLEGFVSTRRSVEGYVEPATAVTPTTVVLVASDGEWTRRRVPTPQEAAALGRRLGIGMYDVGVTGYPDRMRQWTAANKGRDARRAAPPQSGKGDPSGR